MSKIGIFGITANPTHVGHINVMNSAIELGLDQVWVVPSFSHPLKGSSIVSYEHRVAMCELTMSEMLSAQNKARIKLVELEQVVSESLYDNTGKPTAVYTIDLMRWLEKKFPSDTFVLVFGEDNIEGVKKYKCYDELKSKWDIVFIAEVVKCHSSYIREHFFNLSGLEKSSMIGLGAYKYALQHNIYSSAARVTNSFKMEKIGA